VPSAKRQIELCPEGVGHILGERRITGSPAKPPFCGYSSLDSQGGEASFKSGAHDFKQIQRADLS